MRKAVAHIELDEFAMDLIETASRTLSMARTDEVVLRPLQAERLAESLLAYANGDHKLPPDAVLPVRLG